MIQIDHKVSIIVPVFNTPINLLNRSLQSVLNQTYKNLELVVIDDGSTKKEVWEYIISLNDTANCKIIKYKKEKNKGKSDSLNIGVRKATGEYYCILDHDDYLKKDYVERMVQCAVEECADLVVGGMDIIDDDGTVISKYPLDKNSYGMCDFTWSSPVNLARLYRRQMVIDRGITYPNGCWTEDIIFTGQAYYEFKATATLSYEGYIAFINPLSTSRSRGFHKLLSS